MKSKAKKRTPVNGVCCSCGHKGARETPCPARDDKTHCEHWWDGPDEKPKAKTLQSGRRHGKEAATKKGPGNGHWKATVTKKGKKTAIAMEFAPGALPAKRPAKVTTHDWYGVCFSEAPVPILFGDRSVAQAYAERFSGKLVRVEARLMEVEGE